MSSKTVISPTHCRYCFAHYLPGGNIYGGIFIYLDFSTQKPGVFFVAAHASGHSMQSGQIGCSLTLEPITQLESISINFVKAGLQSTIPPFLISNQNSFGHAVDHGFKSAFLW